MISGIKEFYDTLSEGKASVQSDGRYTEKEFVSAYCRKRIGCEVDFVANRGNTRIYIQSAYHMDVDVQKREKRPYLSMKDSFRT